MSQFYRYFGEAHLLLVHLPIGMMLLALVFQRMGRRPRNAVFRTVVPTILLIASGFAVLACISGLVLAPSGDYKPGELFWHLWLSIALTALSIVAWRFSGREPGTWQLDVWRNFITVAIFILMLITGYLGTMLSHGDGYIKGPQEKGIRLGDPSRAAEQ
jgi:uncharacterized membrane protein